MKKKSSNICLTFFLFYGIIFIENKEREKITMYGYNMKELETFIKEKIGEGLSIATISERGYNLPGYLGNGISRTTLQN